MRLEGEIAIVTGAGQGIGQQIALRLGQEGALVCLVDIQQEGVTQTEDMIAKAGGAKAKSFLRILQRRKK